MIMNMVVASTRAAAAMMIYQIAFARKSMTNIAADTFCTMTYRTSS